MDESPSKREWQWRLTKAFLPAIVFFGLGALIGVGGVRKAEAEGNSSSNFSAS